MVGAKGQSPLFELIHSSESGIEFNNHIEDSKEHNILIYSNYYGGGGVAIADFDNDGLQDIYFAGNLVSDQLYKNKGDLKFEEISEISGIKDNGAWSSGVIVGDVNNDGLPDIYITCELYDDKPELRANKLYINQGDFKFKDAATEYNVAGAERTRGAIFIDYDKDGYLDLYLLNQPPNPGNYSKFTGQNLLSGEWHPALYKNVDGKYFEEVTENSGLNTPGYPNSAIAVDVNNDGWQDIYLSNDYDAPDALYINNRDGSFTNIVEKGLKHMSYYSMGVDAADINNDGLMDIMTLDMVAEDNYRQKANMGGMYPEAFWSLVERGGHYQYMYNTLQLNRGNNHYSNIAQMSGVHSTDWSWSNIIADFDNDGWKDIYVTNGLLRDIRNSDVAKAFPKYVQNIAKEYITTHPDADFVPILDIMDLQKGLDMHPSVPLANYSFKNNGDLTFTKMTNEWGMNHPSFSNGCAYGDLDNDGDLDIVVNNINTEAFLYENTINSNYLRIQLVDDVDSHTIQGAKVRIDNRDVTQYAEVTRTRGMYSSSENIVHFGLGELSTVDVKVTWPDGKIQKLSGIAANQLLLIKKSESGVFIGDNVKNRHHIINEVSLGVNFRHAENEFDDFKRQVLLPHEMSRMGPAMTLGDVNGDGLEDIFIGGASGQLGELFIQNEMGSFGRRTVFDPEDAIYEDVDAVFFDYDGDTDLDLYIMSGGNAFPSRNKNYLDRIYENDGAGNLVKRRDVIPRILESGGCVRPFDYDNDGDLDLFLGGRHSPWDYPSPTISRLLENDEGKYVDVTKTKARDFIFNGMVSDAVWSDYNKDGLTDLIAVGEWMPITFYKNNGRGLEKDATMNTKKGGIPVRTNGWWSSIIEADLDNDGYKDYICGNLGKNYKYKASQTEPFEVHYGDFDDSGQKDIVLSYYNFGERFPLRGRSCSSQQVPMITKDFPTYDLFAQSGLTDVYDPQRLEQSLNLKAFMFESLILMNQRDGSFEILSLPNELQVSDIQSIVPIDNQGVNTFLAAGNKNHAEIETPKNDASVGLIFKVLNDGIKVYQAHESGIYLPYAVREMSTIQIGAQTYLIVASNDDDVRLFPLFTDSSQSN